MSDDKNRRGVIPWVTDKEFAALMAAVFFIALLFGPILSRQQSDIEPKYASYQPSKNPNVRKLPTSTEPSSKEHNGNAAEDSKESADGKLGLAGWLASLPGDGLAQWIMAALSGAAVLVSVWAVWLVKRSLEQGRLATEAATIGANAAVEAANITRNAAQSELQPYIEVETVRFGLKDAAPKEYFGGGAIADAEFKIDIKNVGLTPANHVSILVFLKVDGIEDELSFPVQFNNLNRDSPAEFSMLTSIEPFPNSDVAYAMNVGDIRVKCRLQLAIIDQFSMTNRRDPRIYDFIYHGSLNSEDLERKT